MNLLSLQFKATVLPLVIPLVFGGAPVMAADFNGNGIDDWKKTLTRAGDYDYDADVDADDFAALAANLASADPPAPDRQFGRDTA